MGNKTHLQSKAGPWASPRGISAFPRIPLRSEAERAGAAPGPGEEESWVALPPPQRVATHRAVPFKILDLSESIKSIFTLTPYFFLSFFYFFFPH